MNPTTIASVLLTAPDRERQAAANELKNRLDLRQTAHTGTRGRLDRVQSDHGVAVRQILVAMVSTAGFEPYSALYQPIDPMIPWMVTVAKVQLERARGLIVEDPQASAMAKHFEALPARPMRTSMDAMVNPLELYVISLALGQIADMDDELAMDGNALREIVDWVREVGPGALEGLSFEDAFVASRAHWTQQAAVAGTDGPRPGLVLYQWTDGATLQRLYTRKQMEAEGHLMRNCIGAKWQWEEVKDGEKTVLSYRDAEGSPLADISLLYKNGYRPYLDEALGPDNAGVPFELCGRLIPVLKEAGVETGGAGVGMYVPILVPESRIPQAAMERSKEAFIELGGIEDRIRQLAESRDYEGETTAEEAALITQWQQLADHAVNTVIINECHETVNLLKELAGDRLVIRRAPHPEAFKDSPPLAWAVELDLDAFCAELYVSAEDLAIQWATYCYPWDADDILMTDNYTGSSLFRLLSDTIFGTGHVQIVYPRTGLPDWAKVDVPGGEWLVDTSFLTDTHTELEGALP